MSDPPSERMAKFLLLIAVLAAVYFLWKAARIARPPKDDATDAPARDHAVEAMVRCAHCGVYFPRSEAVAAGDASYCSPDHRDAALADRRDR